MIAQLVSPQIEERLIRECAYLIWNSEGKPEGRELEHWLEAERQLRYTSLVSLLENGNRIAVDLTWEEDPGRNGASALDEHPARMPPST